VSQHRIPPSREKAGLAVALAWVAAFVDAVGYLTLLHIGVSHISGDTINLGISLSEHDWSRAVLLLTPIPLFVFGVLLGTFVVQLLRRAGAHSIMSVTLGLELVLLGIFMAYGAAHFRRDGFNVSAAWQLLLLVALITIPMGFQTATLQRVAGRPVRTTYMTGMLSDLAEEAIQYAFWLRDRMRQRPLRRKLLALRLSWRQRSLRRVVLTGCVWLAYLVGALTGTIAELTWHLAALSLPLGALALMILVDLIWPTNPPDHGQRGELGAS
jgi:uncharacterized membrane protein YoaK (UPF0700 family)